MVVELKVTVEPLNLKPFEAREILGALEKEIQAMVEEYIELFKLGTQTWDHQPEFHTEVETTESSIRGEIFTTDRIYRYVSEGTPPHAIPSEGLSVRPMPVAPTGMPKTQPGRLYSIPGYKPPPEGFARSVQHPGIRAREFPKQIMEMKRREILRRLSEALGRHFRVAFGK